jgi:hypothetical protein
MLFTSLKTGYYRNFIHSNSNCTPCSLFFALLLILTALYWFKKSMKDPLVLKSPSNQSNILDISILFWVMVFLVLSLIKLLPPQLLV